MAYICKACQRDRCSECSDERCSCCQGGTAED